MHSRYFWWCEVQGTDDTVWYLKVQVQCWQFTVVLSWYFCASVLRKYMCTIHFQSSLQMPNRWASRRKSSLSTNAGDNLFRFASIISPAALKSLSTAVEVAGGVRYLVIKDWIKGKDNSSHIHLLAKATKALLDHCSWVYECHYKKLWIWSMIINGQCS